MMGGALAVVMIVMMVIMCGAIILGAVWALGPRRRRRSEQQ